MEHTVSKVFLELIERSTSVQIALLTAVERVLSCHAFDAFPHPSPGYPPPLHTPIFLMSETSSESSHALHQLSLTSSQKRHLTLRLTLDAFEVMQVSPNAGEVLILQAPAMLETHISTAATIWLHQCAVEYPTSILAGTTSMITTTTTTPIATTSRKQLSKECRELIEGWPAAFTEAALHRTLVLHSELLFLRVPHILVALTRPGEWHRMAKREEARTKMKRKGMGGSGGRCSEGDVELQTSREILTFSTPFTTENGGCTGDKNTEREEVNFGRVSQSFPARLSSIARASDLPSLRGSCRESATRYTDPLLNASSSPIVSPPPPLAPAVTSEFPSASFAEVANHVSVQGVVHEVYYSRRDSIWPEPWVMLLMLHPASFSLYSGNSSSHSNLNSADGSRGGIPQHSTHPSCRLAVDLQGISIETQRKVAVVGQVVELQGRVAVSGGCTTRTTGGGRLEVRRYLEAHTACLLYSQCQLRYAVMDASQRSSIGSRTASSSDASSPVETIVGAGGRRREAQQNDDAQVLTPHVVTMAENANTKKIGEAASMEAMSELLDNANEERAAAMAVRCWEGIRLALGLAPTSFVGGDTEGSYESAECGASTEAEWVACTDFFSASLDTTVAMCLTLVSAQLPEDLHHADEGGPLISPADVGDTESDGGDDTSSCGGGVSLLVLDEGADPLVPAALRRMSRAAGACCLELRPSVLQMNSRPDFLLPSYTTQLVGPVPPETAAMATTHTMTSQNQTVKGKRTIAKRQTAPPIFGEVIRGGALSNASGRVLLLQSIEVLPTDTLKLLQDALCTTQSQHFPVQRRICGDNEHRSTVCSDSQDLWNQINGCEVRKDSLPPAAVPTQRQVVQRDGGHLAPYLITRAMICTLRDGEVMLKRQALFELAQRVGVVIRPSIQFGRKLYAVTYSARKPVQCLLQQRSKEWLSILGAALDLPRAAVLREPVKTVHAYTMALPQLTEKCSQLLQAYFLSAGSLLSTAVDATLMQTLVKLTLCHAMLRFRMTRHWWALQRASEDATGQQQRSVPPPQDFAGPPVTALVDALAAIGLCDASLHFTNGSTLLGHCLFAELEASLLPGTDWLSAEAVVRNSSDDTCDVVEEGMHVFLRYIEERTRPDSINAIVSNEGSKRGVGCIVELARSLLVHLGSGIQR